MRIDVGGRELSLTNLDKVLYPATGTTKAEVLDYYVRVAPLLLEQLANRPVTRVRWPHGVGDDHFFEKNLPRRAPSWIRRVQVGSVEYPIVADVAGLVWLAQGAALEFHVPQWRCDEGGTPQPADRLVIDLDPGQPAGLPECCRVAVVVRRVVGAMGLEAMPVLSGSKGLHLYLPLAEPVAEPAELVRQIALHCEQLEPELVLTTMSKEKRRGKVFLDWSQNNPAKTTIAPWSLRGRERPTVAVPLTWDEVELGAEDPLSIGQMTLGQACERAGV